MISSIDKHGHKKRIDEILDNMRIDEEERWQASALMYSEIVREMNTSRLLIIAIVIAQIIDFFIV